MRSLRAVLATVVLGGSVAVGFAVSTGNAAADTFGKLSVKSVGDIIVDAVHKRVFVSDPVLGKIVATDYQGRTVGQLTGLPGVHGLALSADSAHLYAAVAKDGALVTVAPSTLTETKRYPLGDGIYPDEILPLGGKLWFGYDNSADSNFSGGFGYVDPATSTVHPQGTESSFSTAPRLLASPARPGLLVAADVRTSGGGVHVFDVSSGTAILKAEMGRNDGASPDVAFTADGSSLLRVGYSNRWRVTVDNLESTEAYKDLLFTYAADVATDGRIALATEADFNLKPWVHIYEGDSTVPAKKVYVPVIDGMVASQPSVAGGLAWEPGGDRLFTVAQRQNDDFWLVVLNDPTTTPPSPSPSVSPSIEKPYIRLVDPGTPNPRPGVPFTLKGTSFGLPAGAELTVTRTNSEAPSGLQIATVVPDAQGAFSFTDTLGVEGQARYVVNYPGTGSWDDVSGQMTIYAYKISVTLSLNGNNSVQAYGATPTFTAWLRRWDNNRVVEIWADPIGADQPNRLIKKAAVDASGKVSVPFRLTRNTVLTAKYAGDNTYGAVIASSTVYTRVAVSTRVSKHFKTKKIGSQAYYVVRTSKDPYFTTTMTPYPGRYYRLIVERYTGGKWKPFRSGYFKLSSAGKSSTTITGTYPAGARFRVRAEYGTGSYGDRVNAKTYGTWRYYTYAR